MADSLKSILGLTSPDGLATPPYLTGQYLVFLFLWTYGFTSARVWKMIARIDNQANPREDLNKYGAQLVAKGKITQAQLDKFKRMEAAHANGIENFPAIASAAILAHVAGLKSEVINGALLSYTISRIVYVVLYANTTSNVIGFLRGPAYWSGAVICMRLFLQSGKALNSKIL